MAGGSDSEWEVCSQPADAEELDGVDSVWIHKKRVLRKRKTRCAVLKKREKPFLLELPAFA